MTAAPSPLPDGAPLSFEDAYTRLEQTVQRLETGGLSLDEALTLYEEGMRLAGLCTRLLDSAELRISQVSALPAPDRDDTSGEPEP